MKDEKKPGSRTSYRIGFCLLVAVVFLTVSIIALPSIGAALLFNSSLKYKSLPVSHALLNFNQGAFKVGIPYVRIQPLPGYEKNVKPTVGFTVNLLNIVF